VDYFGHTALIHVLQQIFNNSVFIGNKERHNLLLLAVDEKLDNFAEVASEDGVDFFVLNFDELE